MIPAKSIALLLLANGLFLTACGQEWALAFGDIARLFGQNPAQATASDQQSGNAVFGYCQEFYANTRISRDQLWRLQHVAPGNSMDAMRSLLGSPYCFTGNTEYFPADWDEATWIGITYDGSNRYQAFEISVGNQINFSNQF